MVSRLKGEGERETGGRGGGVWGSESERVRVVDAWQFSGDCEKERVYFSIFLGFHAG